MSSSVAQLEDTFRLLAEKSPNMIFINRGGHVVYANHRCHDLLGYTAEQICSDDFDFRQLIAPESQVVVDQYFTQHMRGQDVPPYEYTLLTREGQRLQVINTTRAIQYRGAQAILGIVTDVTALSQAREAAQRGEHRYRPLVEHCPDAILLIGLAGDLMLVNRQAARMLGYTDELQLQERITSVNELLAPEDQDQVQRELLSLIAEGGVRLFEMAYLKRDGGYVLAEAHYTLVRDENQRPTAFISVVRDITRRQLAEQERRQVETQLQHAQKLDSLGLLAGGIAHDFNNLLVGILGNASLILEELVEDTTVRARVEQIEAAAAKASDLTDQLLAYAGADHLSYKLIDLAAVVRQTVELARPRLAATIAIELRCPEGLPPLRGDPDRLQQALLNLLTNAEEAMMPDGGTLSIVLSLATAKQLQTSDDTGPGQRQQVTGGDQFLLLVSDSGPRADEDTLSRAFDPFFSTKGEGRGLGLAAVRGIIQGHGGAITLNQRSGGGVEVRILLPGAAEPPRIRPAASPVAPTESRRVLVVDDEQVVRRVARGMLEKLGYDVEEASNGADALALFQQRQQEVVLVLLDLTMPEMSGQEVLAQLRELSPTLPVVLSSGFSRQESSETLQQGGSVDFIQKPYRLTQLRDVIARALQIAR